MPRIRREARGALRFAPQVRAEHHGAGLRGGGLRSGHPLAAALPPSGRGVLRGPGFGVPGVGVGSGGGLVCGVGGGELWDWCWVFLRLGVLLDWCFSAAWRDLGVNIFMASTLKDGRSGMNPNATKGPK